MLRSQSRIYCGLKGECAHALTCVYEALAVGVLMWKESKTAWRKRLHSSNLFGLGWKKLNLSLNKEFIIRPEEFALLRHRTLSTCDWFELLIKLSTRGTKDVFHLYVSDLTRLSIEIIEYMQGFKITIYFWSYVTVNWVTIVLSWFGFCVIFSCNYVGHRNATPPPKCNGEHTLLSASLA